MATGPTVQKSIRQNGLLSVYHLVFGLLSPKTFGGCVTETVAALCQRCCTKSDPFVRLGGESAHGHSAQRLRNDVGLIKWNIL